MNCAGFERWLDAGMPAGRAADAEEALGHAAACADCARSLEAARAVQAALSRPPEPAPARFAASVMGRIAAGAVPARMAGEPRLPKPDFPLWARVLAEPSSALAFLLGGLLLAGHERVAATAGVLSAGLMRTADRVSASEGDPQMLIAVGATLLVLALLSAPGLYRTLSRALSR